MNFVNNVFKLLEKNFIIYVIKYCEARKAFQNI